MQQMEQVMSEQANLVSTFGSSRIKEIALSDESSNNVCAYAQLELSPYWWVTQNGEQRQKRVLEPLL